MSGRVVLVYPRHKRGWEAQPWIDISMGLLCVATPLVRAGYSVKIIDQRVDPDWRGRLERELKLTPICVGVSTSTGPQLKYALEVSELVKAAGSVPVVWGGVHASLLPEQTLLEKSVDFIVQGEGEETLLDLVRALETGRSLEAVAGIWFRENGRVRNTEERNFVDLDRQPPLAYHLLPLERYRMNVFGVERLSFFTSRGCPHGCTFCFNAEFDRRRWRAMSAPVAVQRLIDFAEQHKVGGVVLYDSNFFVDLDRSRQILDGLARSGRGLAVTRLHTRADTLLRLQEEDFELLRRAGCKCLSIGIESGSERIRRLLGKSIDIPSLLEKNRDLRQVPLTPLYLFMMGFPTETESDLTETISLATRLRRDNPRVDVSFNTYTPFPGTELIDLAVQHGLRVPERTEQWAEFNYRNLAQNGPWLSREMRSYVRMLDFCGLFLGKKYVQPYKNTRTLALSLGKLYAPIARWRLRNLCARFPLEVWLARRLGVYGRQS